MTDSGKRPPTDFAALAAALYPTMQNQSAKPTANELNSLLGGLAAAQPRNALADLFAAASPDKPTTPETLSSILAALTPSPALPYNALAGLGAQNALGGTFLGGILDGHRTRSSWNDRFGHWEKPASVSEAGTIERAQSNVLAALNGNAWLSGQKVLIERQGSYLNRTNVRTEADIDLRAEHPALKIEYAPNVVQDAARNILSYGDYGLTFKQIFDAMRGQLLADLRKAFGAPNVVPGKKAIRIKGITGSRAEVDVVPTIQYRHVTWIDAALGGHYDVVEGVAILSTDDQWTFNFPGQHESNGIAKRTRTSHKFKKVVRIFKRLRADMAERGLLTVPIPSFLVECLVYVVEDSYFTVPGDDAYDRVAVSR